MRPTLFTTAALLWTFGAATAGAAQVAPLRSGARVRLTVPCPPAPQPPAGNRQPSCSVRGDFVALRSDTIALATDGSRASYLLGTVRQLEVSRGVRSRWVLGAGIGFVAGAGGTFFVLHRGGSTSPCDRTANQDALRPGECLGLAGLGGLAGAGLGALVGSRLRAERWEKVPLSRLRLTVVAQGRFVLGPVVEF